MQSAAVNRPMFEPSPTPRTDTPRRGRADQRFDVSLAQAQRREARPRPEPKPNGASGAEDANASEASQDEARIEKENKTSKRASEESADDRASKSDPSDMSDETSQASQDAVTAAAAGAGQAALAGNAQASQAGEADSEEGAVDGEAAAATKLLGGDARGQGQGQDEGDNPSDAMPGFRLIAKGADAPASSGDAPSPSGQSPAVTSMTVDGARAGGTELLVSSATAEAPRAESLDELDGQNVARVARGLRSALQQQGGSLTLRLDPPELGSVRIQLEVQRGVVRALIHTQNESVRHLLNHQLSHLRQSLESQGLTVERLEVQTPQTGPSWFMREDTPGDGRSRGQQHPQRQTPHRNDEDRDQEEFDDFMTPQP